VPRSTEADGEKQPVWDLPTRLVHWSLALLIGFSWWSAKTDHMDWHIWSGIAILTLLVFRLLWGFVGSSTARFSNFIRGPRAVRAYLRGEWRGIGHSPLGAISVVALLAAVAVQVGLGLISEDEDGLFTGPLAALVGADTAEAARDIHEQFLYVVLALIALHIAAVLLYALRGKNLTAAMVSGHAAIDAGGQPMRPAKWWVALVVLLISLAVARWVVAVAPPFSP
jgi:cytochrome b